MEYGSTPNNCLGVLGGILPLAEKFGYYDALSLDMVPSESFTRHELPAFLGIPLVDVHLPYLKETC
jgi:hypothetical protein